MRLATLLTILASTAPFAACQQAASTSSSSGTAATTTATANASDVLDTTFNSQGWVNIYPSGADTFPTAAGFGVALQSDGKIVAAGVGKTSNGSLDMIVYRYNSDGTIDTTFGTDGLFSNDNPMSVSSSGTERGNGLVIDSSDNIYVTGSGVTSTSASPRAMIVWKLTSSGALDTTFDSDGIVSYSTSTSVSEYGSNIKIDGSGKIVVVGKTVPSSTDRITVWRYNTDGSLDTSFGGGDGIYVNTDYDGFGQDTIVHSSGKLTILAEAKADGSSDRDDLVLIRLNSDGTVDTSFGTSGVTTTDGSAGSAGAIDSPNAIVESSDGSLVITGYAVDSSSRANLVVWKYTSAGALDTSFGGGDGIYAKSDGASSAAGGTDIGNDLAILSDGSIFIVGNATGSGSDLNDMIAWRVTSSGELDTTFAVSGVFVHDNVAGGDGSDRGYALAVDSSGNIVVTGTSDDASDDGNLVIWRLISN